MDIETIDKEEEEIDIELTSDDPDTDANAAQGSNKALDSEAKAPKQTIQQLLARQSKFLDMCQETKTVSFLTAVCQLSHNFSELSAHLWVELFPRIWKVSLYYLWLGSLYTCNVNVNVMNCMECNVM